jgi:carbon storage regulator CsrA
MLILSRKVGQQIAIGDGIVVMVTKIQGDRCWLGLAAAREIEIWRTEIRDRERCLTQPPHCGTKVPS